MFKAQILKNRVEAVVGPPGRPKTIRQWMGVLPPIAAREAAKKSEEAAAAELAAGAPAFPNPAETGGSGGFDMCIGLLGYPKAGISALLHSFSLNKDVDSTTVVPRYKSVLLTIRLKTRQQGAQAISEGAEEEAFEERCIRLLLMDIGTLVPPVKQMSFWRHGDYSSIEHTAAEVRTSGLVTNE